MEQPTYTPKVGTSILGHIPLSEIKVGSRFRDGVGSQVEFIQLRESIAEKGVLQPITLDLDHNLIAGFRRYQACEDLGLETIPALIRPVDGEVDARECELIENVNRLDMTWQEKTALIEEIDRLYTAKFGKSMGGPDKGKWSNTKTAELLGKSKGSVLRSLQIAEALKLMPELADCKTEDEAVKRLKKMEEEVLVTLMMKKQQEEGGVSDRARLASTNYHTGDALAGMKEVLADLGGQQSMVSLIEVDPPYGIELGDVKRRDAGLNTDLDKYSEIDSKEYPQFLHDVADLTYQCAGKDCWMIFWFGPTWHAHVITQLRRAGWKVDDIPGIWFKGGGQTNAPEIYLARSYEPFFICRKGDPILRQRGRSNVFQYPPVPSGQKYHPTQRPLDLMVELLETFAYPGAIMMSPFLGSGVALRAAYETGLKGFGWDLDIKLKERFLLEVQRDAESAD